MWGSRERIMTATGTLSSPSAPLAILGGPAVFIGSWPKWPRHEGRSPDSLLKVLDSGRWAVSGPWTGRPPLDVEFAERFAAFVGAQWCVPVDHGSSALLAALTALDVGPGDEVIVPGLTWVACASAVLRAGGIPILIDIDPDTLCLAPAAVEAAITPRTAAILAVHLYSAMAEMDQLGRIAAAAGIPVLEDAAQAHGARWRGIGAGSLGAIGTFSMQQGKVLTSGEGGAAVTSDPRLRNRLEQLRGDGRRYTARDQRVIGRQDLEEVGEVQGWNMHLSEVQAALLLDGLEQLPEQNARRAQAAQFLDSEFASLEGVTTIRPYPENTARTYYHYVLRIEPDAWAARSIDVICEAMSAELGAWIHSPYRPLNAHPLFQPQRHPFARLPGWAARLDPRRFELPEAHRQADRAMLFHHSMLLGDRTQLAAIVEAVTKVQRYAYLLPEHTSGKL